MRITITLFFLLSLPAVFAQNKTATKKIVTLSFVSPGFGYEQPLANRITLKTRAALSFNWSYSSSDFLGTAFEFAPGPLAAAHFRYYYNFEQREHKGRRTDLNSANFLSLLVKYSYSNKHYHYGSNGNYRYFSPTHSPDVGIVWGMQRNYNNRFNFDCSVGPSIYKVITQQQLSFIADLTFGIWLGQKKAAD